MKFRFYITNLYSGSIAGTNSEKTAIDSSQCEDFFVVDSETGEWFVHGIRTPVNDIKHQD